MVTSNSTVSAPSAGVVAARRHLSRGKPSPGIGRVRQLPQTSAGRCLKDNRGKGVRRVMRPPQWRTSTHLIVGVGVLAIVAAVVAATALFSASGRGASGPQVPPPPPAVTAKPSIVPVAATVPVPTKSALAATLAAVVADPNLGKLGGRVTAAMTAKELWQQ